METMTCGKCGYKWTPKVANPKSCPSCKRYLEKRSSRVMKSHAHKDLVLNCESCGRETNIWWTVEGMNLCPSCASEKVLKPVELKETRIDTKWRELLPEEKKKSSVPEKI